MDTKQIDAKQIEITPYSHIIIERKQLLGIQRFEINIWFIKIHIKFGN